MICGTTVRKVRQRLGLNEILMAEILGISVQELKKIENDSVNMSAKIVEKLTNVFDIDGKSLINKGVDAGLIGMTLRIDTKKFNNIFKAYAETLKKYFSTPWEVYVSARVKVKKGASGIFDLFFNNNRVSVATEMENFSPSYFVKNGKIRLIVNFEKDVFKVLELGEVENEERFIFKGYRYTKANKIELK